METVVTDLRSFGTKVPKPPSGVLNLTVGTVGSRPPDDLKYCITLQRHTQDGSTGYKPVNKQRAAVASSVAIDINDIQCTVFSRLQCKHVTRSRTFGLLPHFLNVTTELHQPAHPCAKRY